MSVCSGKTSISNVLLGVLNLKWNKYPGCCCANISAIGLYGREIVPWESMFPFTNTQTISKRFVKILLFN